MNAVKLPSPGARAALLYITIGALLIVWTAVWYTYLKNYPPQSDMPFYFCYGLLASGAILLVIGLTVGRIGHSAREADQLVKAPVITPAPVVGAVPAAPPANNGAVPDAPVATVAPAVAVPATGPQTTPKSPVRQS